MKKRAFVFFGLAGILSLGVFWTTTAQAKSKKFNKTFTLEAACDGETLGPADSDFARGELVVINGDIYPEGSLSSPTTGSDPIGTWRCLFASLAEPPVAGAVIYYFALDDSKESLILVQGLNSHFPPPDSVPKVLAIVGGTGKYAGATGEVREEVIGLNDLGCFDLRFHFKIRRHR